MDELEGATAVATKERGEEFPAQARSPQESKPTPQNNEERDWVRGWIKEGMRPTEIFAALAKARAVKEDPDLLKEGDFNVMAGRSQDASKELLGLKLPVRIVKIDEINHTAEPLIGDNRITVLHAASGGFAGYGAAIQLLQDVKDWYGTELVDEGATIALERNNQEAHYSNLRDKLARRKYAEDPKHHFNASKSDDMYNAEAGFDEWANQGSMGSKEGKKGTRYKIPIVNVAASPQVEGDLQVSGTDLSNVVERDNAVLENVFAIPGKVLLICLDDVDRQTEMKKYEKTRIDLLLHDKDAELAKFEVKRDPNKIKR